MYICEVSVGQCFMTSNDISRLKSTFSDAKKLYVCVVHCTVC